LVPDLQKEVYEHLQVPPGTWRCRYSQFGVQNVNDTFHRLQFDDYDSILQGAPDLATGLANAFPELVNMYHPSQPAQDTFDSNTQCVSVDDHIYVSRGAIGDQYAFKRIGGIAVTDFDAYFLLMFTLSSLVRYRQDKWAALLARMNNDQIFLVQSAMDLAIIRFPWLVLSELEEKDFIFLAESSWG
jgi:hypothetical protein